jgi:hypothetical protein
VVYPGCGDIKNTPRGVPKSTAKFGYSTVVFLSISTKKLSLMLSSSLNERRYSNDEFKKKMGNFHPFFDF